MVCVWHAETIHGDHLIERNEELSERMIDAWAEFFKTGKPDHENWPAYTNEMTFTKKMECRVNIERERL